MAVPVIVMPDAKLVVVEYLRSEIAARPEAFAQGVSVGTRLPPATDPGRFVRVRRVGGSADEVRVIDRARIDVQIWHETEEDREALGQLVRALLTAMVGVHSGVMCYGGRDFMPPMAVPDPADDSREVVMLTVEVSLRGA